MADKLPILVLFACAGVLLGLLPTLTLYLKPTATHVPSNPVAGNNLKVIIPLILIICAGIAGMKAAASTLLIVAFTLIAAVSSFRRKRFLPEYFLAMLAGLIIAATLPWWHRYKAVLKLSSIQLVGFTVLTSITVWVLEKENKQSKPPSDLAWLSPLLIVIFLTIIAALSFTTGLFSAAAWHHWGAYIGPSELLLAGAKLFRDFPAQYGLGPTVLIASACGNNCWEGMYYIVGISTLLYFSLIAFIAHNESHDPIQRSLILLLIVACCFWISYPANFKLLTATPSTGGLRFLPILAFVSLLLWLDRKTLSKTRHFPYWVGHLAWAAAALWSPESAFYATFVWWPYYLFLRCAVIANNRNRSYEFIRSAGTLLTCLALLVICFVTVYWLIYQTTPSIHGYLIYMLSPPGLLPIEKGGAVWFFIAVMLLGVTTNFFVFRRSGNSTEFRKGFLLSLMAYATFSYYLGRSHENNILNLMPFLLLVLLNTHNEVCSKTWQRGISAALIAPILGWVSVFGFSVDSSKLEFNPIRFQEKISATINDRGGSDIRSAITYLKVNFDEPITIIDDSLNLSSTAPASAWSAIHGPANFVFVPSKFRREFLGNTALTIKRSGWLMVDEKYLKDKLVSDFDSAYHRTHELKFGNYHLIRYAPMPSS